MTHHLTSPDLTHTLKACMLPDIGSSLQLAKAFRQLVLLTCACSSSWKLLPAPSSTPCSCHDHLHAMFMPIFTIYMTMFMTFMSCLCQSCSCHSCSWHDHLHAMFMPFFTIFRTIFMTLFHALFMPFIFIPCSWNDHATFHVHHVHFHANLHALFMFMPIFMPCSFSCLMFMQCSGFTAYPSGFGITLQDSRSNPAASVQSLCMCWKKFMKQTRHSLKSF